MQECPIPKPFRYLLLVVICASHQANRTVASVVEGPVARIALENKAAASAGGQVAAAIRDEAVSDHAVPDTRNLHPPLPYTPWVVLLSATEKVENAHGQHTLIYTQRNCTSDKKPTPSSPQLTPFPHSLSLLPRGENCKL